MKHDSFATTTRGLRRDILPMRLWEKAKKLGIWNPADIDFTQDAEDWKALTDPEREMLLRLTTQFQAGEEAVTLDLLPLISAIAREGRIEEEMFLTTFLWEEAKHVDFFNRFLTEAVGGPRDLSQYMTPTYSTLFYEVLPEYMYALHTDQSPEAQLRASTLYNMIVEGGLAETGYHYYFSMLDERGILPGQREGISLIKLDESRHIAYGVFLISRLVNENPSLWSVFESTMAELAPMGAQLIAETFEPFGDDIPFGLSPEYFEQYVTGQFGKRFARVEKALSKTLEEIYGAEDLFIDAEASVLPGRRFDLLLGILEPHLYFEFLMAPFEGPLVAREV